LIGLIKVTDTIDLCCDSDPAVGGEGDGWQVKNGAKGATVVTVRALNDREMLRLSGLFRGFETEDGTPTANAAADFGDAMAEVVRAAFVRCAEGDEVTTDPGPVLEAIKLGPLIGLGNFILEASGHTADPT